MIKKLLVAFVLCLFFASPITSFGQQADYFPDRLIIKYAPDQKLQQIKSRSKIDPRSAVQKILYRNSVRENRPLLSEKLRQSLQQQRYPSADDVLRIREVVFSRDINPEMLAAKISRMPGVEYAEPKYLRTMSYTPDDPELEKFIDAHNFTDAWDLSQGSRDVVIAINDGGVNYTHPDLDDNMWINQDEVPPTLQPQVDQNADGDITSTEIYEYLQQNGQDYNSDGQITLEDALHNDSSFMDDVDADNNNFTDDLYGWDFWASGGVSDPITQNNNPIEDGTDHGTHVAGISAAETDNGTAVAGAGFNVTYMPVKTGGIPDDPSTPDTDESRSIGFGFDGIVYAAQNGADIINCSWGGSGASQAEQDIVNLATEMGALVIAASGNAGVNEVGFPSGYDKVLAVGSVQTNGSAASYSNYGYRLDVLATGTDILSTSSGENLVSKSGTSMATPVVSGLAGLVKAIHPNWSSERISRQIRASATFIDDVNPEEYNNRLGHGSIDAFRALDTNLPGLKIVSRDFVDGDGNKLTLGEPGFLDITLTNVGNDVSPVELRINSLTDVGIDLGINTQQLGSIANGDTVNVSFELSLADNFDLSQTPTLRLNFLNDNQDYEDFGILQYDNLTYDIVAGNNVKTSFGTEGTIGFTDPFSGTGGVGFIPRTPDGTGSYQEGDNLLFEGGLILEIDGQIFDATRASGNLSRDFIPQQVFATVPTNNGVTGSARFVTDTDTANQTIIDLETFAFDEPTLSNVVFVKYTIQNPSSFVVKEDVYAGLFNDWDLGNPGNNNASYSQADSVLYLSDATSGSTQPVVAVAHLGPLSGALAIDNTLESQADSLTFGLYDGFTDSEKSSALKSETVRTEVSGTDVSSVIASGPYTINPGAQVTIGFVYVFGDDVNELRNQIAEARSRNLFAVSNTGTAKSDDVPPETQLFQNYPNPFRDDTQLRLDLQQATNASLTVYNTLGRKVRVVADREFEAGSHFIPFNADNLSSGVYFLRLKTDQGSQTIPMTLIK